MRGKTAMDEARMKYLWVAVNRAPDFRRCVSEMLEGKTPSYPVGCTFPWTSKDQLSWQDALDAAQMIRHADAAGIILDEKFGAEAK